MLHDLLLEQQTSSPAAPAYHLQARHPLHSRIVCRVHWRKINKLWVVIHDRTVLVFTVIMQVLTVKIFPL